MTRIEDLSEFLHNDDPEADRLLNDDEDEAIADEDTEVSGMNSFPYQSATDEQEDDESTPDLPQNLPGSALDELEDDTEDALSTDELPDLPVNEDSNFDFSDDEASEGDDAFGQSDSFFDSSSEDESADDPFSESAQEVDQEDESEEDFLSAQDPFTESDEDEQESSESDLSFGSDEESDDDSTSEDLGEDENEDESETENDTPTFTSSESVEQEDLSEESPPISAGASYPPRENFEDLKKFANSLSYGDVSSPGNPPFSLVIKDIRYTDDAQDILRILREHGLINPENEKDFSTGLEQGAILIGQLSEYSAIFLAHRLRRFDLDISIGLSDEIHPSKSYEREGRGLTTKDQLYQNKKSNFNLERTPLNPNDIIVATTPSLPGYKVERYIDVITEHLVISEEDLRQASSASSRPSEISVEQSDKEELSSDYHIGLSQVYYALMQELKPRAYKLGGNAVLGINFSLTTLAGSEDYKITCAGNVAWINND